MKRLILESRPAMANTAVTVVHMEGELDTATAPEFESKLQELLNQRRYKIVLNMKSLVYVSSDGIGVLTSVIKKVRENRGDIKMTHVHPDVYDVFQLLELPKLFRILKIEEEGVRDF
ncbi:MAG TPA: STAS domain-containing protein [bacterium]|nr:STAS domain-containing protein [bacterium]